MRKIKLSLLFVLSAGMIQAQVNDTIRILNVVPGTFESRISGYGMDSIFNLVVTGRFDNSDFSVFGNDTVSHRLPVLQYLDISGLDNDTLPTNTFKYYNTLHTCLLSDSVKLISDWCFQESALTSIRLPEGVWVGIGGFLACKLLSDTLRIPPRSYLGLTSFSYGGETAIVYETGDSYRNVFSESANLVYVDLLGSTNMSQISGSMFRGDNRLAVIYMPATIRLIDDFAFDETPELKTIYLYAPTPPTLGSSASFRNTVFTGVPNDQRVLYVPKGSKIVYKATDVWKEFDVQELP